jgi:parallel beta-helix repeat protein
MDKYSRLRKCLTVGIILLFVGTCLIPVTAQNKEKPSLPTSGGNWLYVGGSGPGNYSVIQDAIDNASDGDTIYVYHGIYSDFSTDYGCIQIKKVLNLLGENKLNTILNGTGYARVLIVDADEVSVSGFTVQNGGAPEQEGYFGVGIDVGSGHRNIRIYNNIITENQIGIWIDQNSTDVFIYDNSLIGNYYGIETLGISSFIKIYNNTISNNNGEGLSLSLQKSYIYNNIISNNSIGLLLYGGDSACVISNNQIQESDIGIQLVNARYTIQNNNFIHNTKQADIQKVVPLLGSPLLPFFRQNWNHNYWDDWNIPIPRLITGSGIVYIYLLIGGGYKEIPIAFFIFLEFDWHPVQELYDIPSLCTNLPIKLI